MEYLDAKIYELYIQKKKCPQLRHNPGRHGVSAASIVPVSMRIWYSALTVATVCMALGIPEPSLQPGIVHRRRASKGELNETSFSHFSGFGCWHTESPRFQGCSGGDSSLHWGTLTALAGPGESGMEGGGEWREKEVWNRYLQWDNSTGIDSL